MAGMDCRPRHGGEAAIEDLLADPIVDLVLARDGLSRADLDRTISFLRDLTTRKERARDD